VASAIDMSSVVGLAAVGILYAAAGVVYLHGILSDPLLQNRPVDWMDAEKAYVEGCALLVAGATVWRYRYARGRRLARVDAHFTNMSRGREGAN